ncbi:MAG TPA: hypothetical protein VIW26_04095 [Gemmatimonadales bacterium]|jgi:hypothetical protein
MPRRRLRAKGRQRSLTLDAINAAANGRAAWEEYWGGPAEGRRAWEELEGTPYDVAIAQWAVAEAEADPRRAMGDARR